jgi:hypothetical protein
VVRDLNEDLVLALDAPQLLLLAADQDQQALAALQHLPIKASRRRVSQQALAALQRLPIKASRRRIRGSLTFLAMLEDASTLPAQSASSR